MKTFKVEIKVNVEDTKRVLFESITQEDFCAWFYGKYNSRAVFHPDMPRMVYRPRDKKGNAICALYVTPNI